MTTEIQSWRGYALAMAVVILPSIIAFGANQLVSKDKENMDNLKRHEKQMNVDMETMRSEMWTRREQEQFNNGRIREFDSHVKRCEAERDSLKRELDIMRIYVEELKEDLRRLEDRYQLDQINEGGLVRDDIKTANLSP